MAIIILKGGEKTYVSATGTGRVSDEDTKRADEIFDSLTQSLADYEKDAIEAGDLSAEGVKKNALKIWYEIGRILNEIAAKYKILGTSEEHYYWESVYDHVPPSVQKLQPPRSASGNRNHFKRSAYMASKGSFSFVEKVGNWSVWRDLLDNSRLQEDPRVFDWVVGCLHQSGLGHKEVRPFIHEVRRSLKGKDTSVLTNKELFTKLGPLKELLEKSQKK